MADFNEKGRGFVAGILGVKWNRSVLSSERLLCISIPHTSEIPKIFIN